MNIPVEAALPIVSGILVALFWRYFPKVKTWFDSLDPTNQDHTKQIVILVSSLAAALLIFGVGCAGYGGQYGFPQVSCDKDGAVSIAASFVLNVVGTQAIYPLIKKK